LATNVHANKRKGYNYEIDCRDFLIDDYPEVGRNGTQYGPNDRGDLSNVSGWTLQCKNVKTDKWTEWFKAVTKQAENNKTRWWAILRKARGKSVGESLFVMPFHLGRDLMVHLRDLETENAALKQRIKELENVV
jgi:hypothetical protein